jgi:D-alanyl-D-alanine dipeptidase
VPAPGPAGDRATPIPVWNESPGWRHLPIVEGGEPLVPITPDPAANLDVRPMYALAGVPGASMATMVRVGVAARLRAAAADLATSGAVLVVFDGYRPLAVQRYLYITFAVELRTRHPHLARAEFDDLLHRYVASPNVDPTCPPPHRTGGAVDVFLATTSGESLPMGTEPDEAVPESATRAFESLPASAFAENRRLLFHAMQRAGFANYYGEWWHYDFGNQRWANLSGAPAAVYGIAPETK